MFSLGAPVLRALSQSLLSTLISRGFGGKSAEDSEESVLLSTSSKTLNWIGSVRQAVQIIAKKPGFWVNAEKSRLGLKKIPSRLLRSVVEARMLDKFRYTCP